MIRTSSCLSMLTSALTMAVLAPDAAHAQAHAAATIGNYQYTLTDLAPDDGIAPSITWGPGNTQLEYTASLSNGVGYGGGPNVVASQSDALDHAGPMGASQQALSFAGFTVEGNANGLSTSADMAKGGTWNQTSAFVNTFSLSPHTAITFTSDASIAASVVVPDWSVRREPSGYMNNGYFDWAPLQAGSLAMLYVGENAGSQRYQSPTSCEARFGCLGADALGGYWRTYSTMDVHNARQLSVTVSNDADAALDSKLTVMAYSDGYATAPIVMVPEAGTWAQMVLGLAGLGMLAARRRHRA
jgi:hypothetical protein